MNFSNGANYPKPQVPPPAASTGGTYPPSSLQQPQPSPQPYAQQQQPGQYGHPQQQNEPIQQVGMQQVSQPQQHQQIHTGGVPTQNHQFLGQPLQQQQQQQQQQYTPGQADQMPMQRQPPMTPDLGSVSGGGSGSGSGIEDSTQVGDPGASSTTKLAEESISKLGNRLKGMFQDSSPGVPPGPNFGFTPTAKMAQKHEDALRSSKRPLFQFQVTKLRNWRTGYVRLLCFYSDHVSTVDPETHNPTNTWQLHALRDYGVVEGKQQIHLQFEKDKLKFQCHNVEPSRVLTALLECQEKMIAQEERQGHSPFPSSSASMIMCQRWTRHGLLQPSALRVTPFALVEIHPNTRKTLQTYRFVDIAAISLTSNDPNGLIWHSSSNKLRLFSVPERAQLVTSLRQAFPRLGLELRLTDSMTTQEWVAKRKELAQLHRNVTIATEYSVTKASMRHDTAIIGATGWPGGIVSRTLCLTGNGLILEKDPSDGMTVSCRVLKDLYAIVRPSSQGDLLILEFDGGGVVRTYFTSTRDSLIVSLLDAASTLGKNPNVHVSDVPSAGYNLASFAKSNLTITPEKSGGLFKPISIPTHCLKRVHNVATAAFSYLNSTAESSTEEGQPANPIEECANIMELCREFNASVLPTSEGLPTGEKDKYVLGSIGALWGLVADVLEYRKDRHLAEQTIAPMFQTLHRLSKTVAGYKHAIELATFLDCLPLLWLIEDPFCKFWAFRALTVTISGLPRNRDKEVEYVNKSIVFKAGGPRLISGLVNSLLNEKGSDLIRMVMSDILQSVLCSFADTTGSEPFSALIKALGENYQALLNTLYQQTPFVIENSALLLHLLSTHAPVVASSIREAALSSAILLYHFHAAIFSPLEGQRFLSRFLCSLWLAGPMSCAEKRWLKRTVPSGFLGYLKMPPLSRNEEEQLDELERDSSEENIPESESGNNILSTSYSGAAGTNTSRLRSRIALAEAIATRSNSNESVENFRIFFHVMTQNHSLPDLIWNQQTRRELRIGLEGEIQYIRRETEARGINKIAWNHQQFGIDYPSLENELRVGSVYMRLWLQAGEGFIKSWDEPVRLFELLFRRFLCEIDRNTKVTVMCIRCLERLYAIHGNTIGAFPDVMILIHSMASTRSIETQHRLLGLLATILGVQVDNAGDESTINVQENAEQLLNTTSIEQLCQFVAWGHTNGVQVGNLMTSVLATSYTHSGNAMLTDKTSMVPQESTQKEKLEEGPDADCPAVWFVASTGRIPPPPETIRGPFRISQLKQMRDGGDLSPFSLITSTHVDSYEDDNEGEMVRDQVHEDQIDTGKWKRLDQVWQLRWQLCTDGNDTGLFSPSEVALRAIRSLTRLVDLHKSLDYRNLPYYPIPIAKRIICGLSRDPFKATGGATLGDHDEPFLSIVAQSILCNDPNVVDQSSKLLLKLMKYNEEAMSKFYLTGIFFFATGYTGSNFKNLATLLHSTHLSQHFRSGFAATADTTELPLKDRSILGTLLPEGLLYILLNYGVDRFSEVFVGNFDTPEVIWSFEMRKHLIEMVRQHLGDFPKRLWQNTTTKYEYCPMPGVAYRRLEREIFCHNYYLNNLCDEGRFPDWPIAEPVELFRACLEEFKKQMTRDESEEGEAYGNAVKVLNLQNGDGSKQLRKSYRNLARKYHPDKNPGGREMFESIQSAYELLLPIVESGQKIETFGEGSLEDTGDAASAEGFMGGLVQMRALQLLIRSQALVCRRYEGEMSKYKYPAYPMLLACLKIPSSSKCFLENSDVAGMRSSCLLTLERAEFVRDAVELIYRTCLVSPLNAEELISCSGVIVLDELFNFYMKATNMLSVHPEGLSNVLAEILSGILANVIHTLSGIAFYENGRNAIVALEHRSIFCLNWRRCMDGKYLGNRLKDAGDALITRYSLEGVGFLAKDETLQISLVGAGVVWPLLRFLLGFDPTLDDAQISKDSIEDDIGESQATSNRQARLAARGLGMLCGALQDKNFISPRNARLQKALDSLLTPPIAMLLRNKRTSEILNIVNTNIEGPSRIWNVSMRSELSKFVQNVDKSRIENEINSLDDELSDTFKFEYQSLKKELRIGGIYIRLFNQIESDVGATNDIHNPSLFAKQLITFLVRCLNKSKDMPDNWISLKTPVDIEENDVAGTSVPPDQINISDPSFVSALKGLRILVQSNGLVDDVLCNHDVGVTSILLSLLELPQDSEGFDIGCDILATLSPKQHFADAVAEQDSLWRLLSVLERPEAQDREDDQSLNQTGQSERIQKQRGWMLLESLSSTTSIASKIIESSAWMRLLGILVGYSGFTKVYGARAGAAKTLSRLLWDPKTGSVIGPMLQRFLPSTLAVILKEEGADKMLNLFDGESDTPELIWDSSMRSELRGVVGGLLDRYLEERKRSMTGQDIYSLDPSTCVKYKKLEKELFIGGVYVSRFLKEPTYNLRDPTLFLEMLMQRWSHELQLSTSDVSILRNHESTKTTIVTGGIDTLGDCTSAAVYICRLRGNLCSKLSEWGYMNRCLVFLENVLDKELYGSPLLSTMRILSVATKSKSNVEKLILSGKNDRYQGIIPLTMRAIEANELHKDAAFMLEMLKQLFTKSLGDTKNTLTPQRAYAMAPSPAPGEGPVNRNRVSLGNPLDDPLALSSANAPTTGGNNLQTQNFGAPHLQTYGNTPMFGQPSNQFRPQGTAPMTRNQQYGQHSEISAGQSLHQVTPQHQIHHSNQIASAQFHAFNGVANTEQRQQYVPPSGGFAQRGATMRNNAQSNIPHNLNGHIHLGEQKQQTQFPTSLHQSSHLQHGQVQTGLGHQNIHTVHQDQSRLQQHSVHTSNYPYNQNVQQQFYPLTTEAHVSQLPQHPQQQYGQVIPQPQMKTQTPTYSLPQSPQMPHNTPSDKPQQHVEQPQRQQNHEEVAYAQYQSQTQTQSQGMQYRPTLDASFQGQPQSDIPGISRQPMEKGGLAPSHQMAASATTVTSDKVSVETVPQNQLPSPQLPPRIDGSGVDARVPLDPKVDAERRMKTVAGAPGAVDGRVPLMQCAILCELCNFIIDQVLENSRLSEIKDPAAAKLHGVELLKLLTQDPGYGLKFSQILDENPHWKKYKSQDHSLFITGPEQRADYFLTDGSNGDAKKLLTQNESTA